MKHILVTGGAGYIGSHACKMLAAAGYVPVTFDNISTGWRDAVKFGPLVEGDLTEPDSIKPAFEQYPIAAVMHFAALSDVGQSMREPQLYWRNNVLGSMNLANAMLEAEVRDIVFSSTCATYGEQDGVTLDENCPQQPINAYGASKRAIEDLLENYRQSLGLNYVIFRYFNVAGADPAAEIGEFHRPETHLIPIALDAIKGRRDALTIFGDDYNTPDGTCIRDYVHVSDLISAHILGLEWLADAKASTVFNLGTGRGFSVREVISEVENSTGLAVPHSVGPRRPGDCTALVSGSEKAARELGWRPEHSTLDQMIGDAWRWHQRGNYQA